MKAVDLKKQSKIVAEGIQKQSSWIQTILGKIKIKRRVQIFKNLGKQLQLQHLDMTLLEKSRKPSFIGLAIDLFKST